MIKALLLCLCFCGTSLCAQNVLYFSNNSRNTIETIQVKGFSETQWSVNMLNSPLSPRTAVVIDMPRQRSCRYEIRGMDENGRNLFSSMNIDVCQNEVTFTGSSFLRTTPRSNNATGYEEDLEEEDIFVNRRIHQEITFINQSRNESIYALFIKPTRGRGNWSSNLLDGITIFMSQGERKTIRIDDLNRQNCLVDIRANGIGGKDLGTLRNIDLCRQQTVTLRFNAPARQIEHRNTARMPKVRLKNITQNENIHKLYLRPQGSNEWGSNRLDTFTIFLSENETTEISLPEMQETCYFDIRAEGLGGKNLGTLRNVYLCRNETLSLAF